jgi:fluoroquinolone transport system permease protein
MSPLLRSFALFIKQILKDSMLAAVCAATILTAFFVRFGVPEIEDFLCGYFRKSSVLADYYLLFDLFLALISPYMLCFASSMMMLTEYDENMTSYLSVTPVGKKGYILSRLAFPCIIAFILSVVLIQGFSLTDWSMSSIIIVSLLSCACSAAVALLLFVFSHNRVEGMAVAKLSGLLMLGLPVPFFITSPIQYLFAPLPSFWTARFALTSNILFAVPALLAALIWISFLYKKFDKKLR